MSKSPITFYSPKAQSFEASLRVSTFICKNMACENINVQANLKSSIIRLRPNEKFQKTSLVFRGPSENKVPIT